MNPTHRSGLTRRNVIKGGTAIAGTSLAFPHARNAFAQATPDASPAASPVASPAGGEDVIVSSVEGVPNAYLRYPEPFKSVDGVPGKGGTIRMMTLSYSPPPTPKGENEYWKQLEERLGVTWEATLVPIEGYNERISTTFAGGDLPDLMFLLPSSTRPIIYDTINEGAFLDLTDIVESDRIQDYPNLAAIEPYQWDATRFNGRIWGVPKPVLRNNDPTYYRKDWADKLGNGLGNAQEVRDFLVGVSSDDPDENGNPRDTFGLAPYGGTWDSFTINQIFAVPYGWRDNGDGTLTSSLETDEYRAALEFAAQLYQDGAYHPDSAGIDVTAAVELMRSGRTGMATNGFAAVFGPTGFRSTILEAVPDAQLEAIVMPGVDGGKGVTYRTTGIFGYTAIPATAGEDEERLDEILSVLDYLYAPFGSEESTFLRYGLPDVHSTQLEDGGWEVNDQGGADKSALVYPFLSENYFYYPGMPDEAIAAQKHNEEMAKVAIGNPVASLYSPTNGESGSAVSQYVTDEYSNVVTGRSSIDDWDAVIEEWRSRGGDTIRAEYEEALQANQ